MNLRLDQRVVTCRVVVLHWEQLQPRDGADHDGAAELGDDATGARRVALHVEIVRAHVGKGLSVLCARVLRCVDGHAVQVQQALMLDFTFATGIGCKRHKLKRPAWAIPKLLEEVDASDLTDE